MSNLNEIILTKESSNSDIKKYFESIKQMRDSGEKFPVDFDLVWMLVYDRKDNAFSSLKKNYTQDVDYQVFLQNKENPNGGRPIKKYMLSIDCMEEFIAMRSKAVFRVYKEVFWLAYDNKLIQQQNQNSISIEQVNSMAQSMAYGLGLAMKDMIGNVVREAIKSEINSLPQQQVIEKEVRKETGINISQIRDSQFTYIEKSAERLGYSIKDIINALVAYNMIYQKGSSIIARSKYTKKDCKYLHDMPVADETASYRRAVSITKEGEEFIKEYLYQHLEI